MRRNDGTLLVLKRSPRCRNNSRKWEVPGGKVEEGEDPAVAQKREVLEETGLLVEPTEGVVHVHNYTISDGPCQGLLYYVIFCIARLVGGEFMLSDEHSDYAWLDYHEMISRDLTPPVREAAIILMPHLVA